MSLLLALENPLTAALPKLMPILISSIAGTQPPGLRKVGMDIIYSLYVIQGEAMHSHSAAIYQKLQASRLDRNPQVK